MNPTLQQIRFATAETFGIMPSLMCTPSRKRMIARPRQVAMFLAREMTGRSLPRIGQYFGRDHTTVMWAVERVAEISASSPAFAAKVEATRTLILAMPPMQCEGPLVTIISSDDAHAAKRTGRA